MTYDNVPISSDKCAPLATKTMKAQTRSTAHPSQRSGGCSTITGEDVITAPTKICSKILQTGEWPTLWTQSLVITLPKKGNLHQRQNYQTISLISHPNKVMLKIILNRLKPQAERITDEKQAGFRAGRSTTEQILTYESSVRNIFSTSKTSTTSS